MKKNILKVLACLLVTNIISCAPDLSPAVYLSNVSNDYIRNVKGHWGGYYLHGQTELIPGGSSAQSFNVESKSHIFGPVHLEWENASGKKFIKDFIFTKEELPSYLKSDWEISRIKKAHQKRLDQAKTFEERYGVRNPTYFYVQFYFTQDSVEYYTSDNPNIEKIEKEKHDLGVKSLQEFRKRYKK